PGAPGCDSRPWEGGRTAGPLCCTLGPVHLQTQQEVKMRMTGMALRVVRADGVLALYNGLSASLCRQMTYSLTRFAIYETARDRLGRGTQGPPPFYQKVLLGAVGGERGGPSAPSPSGRSSPRVPLPVACRFHRRYSHALDGMYRVLREEGLKKLFSGATMASSRGALVTVGQVGQLRWALAPLTTPAGSAAAEGAAPELVHVASLPAHARSRCTPPGPPAPARAHCLPSPCPLPGLRSCRHPPRSSHRPHLCLPGTAPQILWDQSRHLSGRDVTCVTPRLLRGERTGLQSLELPGARLPQPFVLFPRCQRRQPDAAGIPLLTHPGSRASFLWAPWPLVHSAPGFCATFSSRSIAGRSIRSSLLCRLGEAGAAKGPLSCPVRAPGAGRPHTWALNLGAAPGAAPLVSMPSVGCMRRAPAPASPVLSRVREM
uniref:Solute carrier family 25 member 10 n=1 Tax=Nothoprocta perdicaria TaxID=30464 RepID=A0A8C6ZM62_NOTPE